MSQESPKPVIGNLDLNLEVSAGDKIAIPKICKIAHDLTGIQLNERHHAMVASRLRKRLAELQLSSLSDYLDYLSANYKEESTKLVGLLTTHHTFFFREFSQFEYLQTKVLPKLVPLLKARADKKLRIWAAACSRGQEVYSLAMFLSLHLKLLDPSLKYEILGSDVDPESVGVAKNGVYLRSELKEAPLSLLGDHWVKGTGEIEDYVKAKKSLRDNCRFQVGNLLELKAGSVPNEKFDIIFCRNVFIYFNPDQIKLISQELISRLSPEGYFFIGVSESLSGLKLPVTSAGSSIYHHKDLVIDKPAPQGAPRSTTTPAPSKQVSTQNKLLRILCVDDSPSILTLMKQILTKENGFEVVGVAKNGLEAATQVAALKPDALTLDIHMPLQTGLEYLEHNYRKGHPPVVMVTSVSRENAELAGKALQLGASDYVEKPALTNLAERGEEIRVKLRCAALAALILQAPPKLKLDKAFQSKAILKDPDAKLRIISLPLSARANLKTVLSEFTGVQPHTVIFIEGAKDALPVLSETLARDIGRKLTYANEVPAVLKSDEITILDLGSTAQKLWEYHGRKKQTSILVFGDVSQGGADKLLLFKGAQLVLEDLGGGKGSKALMEVASDVVLSTSFAYLSLEFFTKDQKLADDSGKAA